MFFLLRVKRFRSGESEKTINLGIAMIMFGSLIDIQLGGLTSGEDNEGVDLC